MIVDQLFAALGYKLENEEDLKRFRDGIDGMQKRLERFATRAAEIGRKIALGITAMATTASAALMGAFKFTTSQARDLAALGDVADRLGTDVERLQELRHAATMTGMDEGSFDNAFRRLIRRSAEAAQGTGAAKDAFKELGITLKDNEGRLKAGEDLLLEVADAMMKVKDHGDAMRIGYKMFDVDAAKLMPMILRGSDGIRELIEDGRGRGLFFSQDDIDRARAYTDALDLFWKQLGAARKTIALEMMPALTGMLERLNDWYVLNQAMIRQRMASVIQLGARALETFGATAWRVAGSVEWLSKKIEDLTGLTSGDQMKMLGAGAVGWLAMRHPVLAGLAAAFLMLDDLRAYMEGDDSQIGKFLDELDKVQAKADEFRQVKNYGIPFIPDEWIEQIYNFDEALQRIIGRPPNMNPWGEWNLTDKVLVPLWQDFEAWWDRLVQGFADAGVNAARAFLAGLKDMIIPDWLSNATVNTGPAPAVPVGSIDPSRMHERFREPGESGTIEKMLEGMRNFQGWQDRMSPEAAAASVENTLTDSRDQSVTVGAPNVTVNVQQPVEAPAELGRRLGNATNETLAPLGRRVTGN